MISGTTGTIFYSGWSTKLEPWRLASHSHSVTQTDRLTAIRPFGRSFCGILLKSFNYVEGEKGKEGFRGHVAQALLSCLQGCQVSESIASIGFLMISSHSGWIPMSTDTGMIWWNGGGWWEEKETERDQNATSIPSPSSIHHWPAEDSTPIFPMAPKKAWEAVPVLAKILSCKYTAWCKIDFLH